jgi:hypothetical protein
MADLTFLNGVNGLEKKVASTTHFEGYKNGRDEVKIKGAVGLR